jgi:F-type H+-transporting ATPase subunit delta
MQKPNGVARVVENQIQKYSGGFEDVEVISAVSLTEQQLRDVKSVLEKKLGKVITVKSTLDESLVGGLVFKYDGHVIDASFRCRLKNLKMQMVTNACCGAVRTISGVGKGGLLENAT